MRWESSCWRAKRYALILILFAALVAVAPLVAHGYSCGHDFDFHLVSWMEAANQFHHGDLHPHWAFSPAFNAGEPRFVFYPPLSWTLGAVLGLLFTHLPGITQAAGWSAVPIAYTWIVLTLSGVALYRLARRYTNAGPATIAAVFYAVNPYMLFTAYERTAYAELLAAAWIPMLIGAILQEEVKITGIAIPVALLWLTNAPAAVMGCYVLAFLALFRVITVKKNEDQNPGLPVSSTLLATRIFSGTTLGLALAAFYLLPAVCQRRLVQVSMAMIDGMRIDHNFLFEVTGNSGDAMLHDQVLHTASIIALLLLCTALACFSILLYQRFRRGATDETGGSSFLAFAGIFVGIAFLLTPISNVIWQHAPEAKFLQFPWRLLAILAPVVAVLIARCINFLFGTVTESTRMARGLIWGACGVAIAVALVWQEYPIFRQGCDVSDTVAVQLASFESHTGSGPTDEYTPIAADNDALKPNNPPYWLSAKAEGNPVRTNDSQPPGTAPKHLVLQTRAATFVILNLRDYPAWRIFLNGRLDPTRYHRDDGLIAIHVPAGTSTVGITYATSIDQWGGDIVSLVALVLTFLLYSRGRGRKPNAPAPANS